MSVTRTLVIAGFIAAALAAVALEWVARREGSRVPRLGDVAAVIMRYEVGGLPVGRLALLGFWLWIGWHFLAR
ncbi:MAG TPA: DUF6186 family protein [Candidatus Limnocylindrales bacterium]